MSSTRRRWTLKDVASELRVARSTVEAYRSRGQMPAATGVVGRTPYWSDSAIRPWMDRQKANRKHVKSDTPTGVD